MDMHLTDKVALVTGAARGLGKAIARGFAAEGARVAINYNRSAKAAEALAQQVTDEHRVRVMAVAADVSDETAVEQMFDQVTGELGPIDVLVNNAGTWPTAFVTDLSLQQWQETFAVNATGPFLTCRRLVRDCLDAGRVASIVNISTQAAFRGSTTGHADYAAAKAAVVNFTQSLAREVAARGIRVNGIAPGMMNTDMTRDTLENNLQEYIDRTPLRRIARPGEMADAVVFLASDRASYITGATLDVTGGMLMG